MSRRMVLSISDGHYAMLEEIQIQRGLKNPQEAIRSVLEDLYSSGKKSWVSRVHVGRKKTRQDVGAVT